MSILTIMAIVFVMVLIAYTRRPHEDVKSNGGTYVEVLPPVHTVEVEIIDEMTKEKVRNLYDEQDLYNAKISYLMRQNKQYEYDISKLEERIQRNLADMRTQLMIQPNLDIKILKAGYEESNQNIHRHKLKLEGMILSNQEKILSYKRKSNDVSEQITKIGKEVYKQIQQR